MLGPIRIVWFAVVLTLAVVSSGGRAAAQGEPVNTSHDEEARGLFEAGKAAYDDGRFEAALEYFQRSYALSQRPALQYNLGLAYDRLRRDQEALTAFEKYLAEGPDPLRQQEVENRVRALKEHLARQAEVAAEEEPEVTPAAPPPPAPPVQQKRSDRTRKRWIWAAVGAGVVVVGAGIVATWAAARGGDDGRPKPNTGVTIEALSWH